jgi:AcrR family transcriptional regulator
MNEKIVNPSLQVTSNKQGQALGRKGMATRKRLMDAAERLLKKKSPVELTAVAVAKEAGTSSATFYMYFDDIRDILFSLSELAGSELEEAMAEIDRPWLGTDYEEQALELVEVYFRVWQKHREVLRFRNLEADRGDKTFDKLRMDAYIPELDFLANRILEAAGSKSDMSRGDAYSLASVLHSGLEKLASLNPGIVRKGVGLKRLKAAQARVIAKTIESCHKWGRLPR